MKVLMLGWEFPPFISGGLGTACYGLTRALDRLGVEITFVLPRPIDLSSASHVNIRAAAAGDDADDLIAEDVIDRPGFARVRFRAVDARLNPYARPDDTPVGGARVVTHVAGGATVVTTIAGGTAAQGEPVEPATTAPAATRAPTFRLASIADPGSHYGGDLFSEVDRYARAAMRIARTEEFDVIHAHDWMTFPAGVAVAGISRRPLVVHVHSTEFDRSGENVHQRIYDIERAGMHAATRVIAVSHLTRSIIASRYGLTPTKVEVVYNAIDDDGGPGLTPVRPIERDEKIVLFLGRITMQKGPEYFLAAARRVLEVIGNVRFIMAGAGDMVRRMVELAAEMGIGDRVLFTGFLRGPDVGRVFRMADLYVMPSVSEPFGITPLEALSNDVPVLISKQSGVAEVLQHALKVDFWDVDDMANKIIAVLRHPPLHNTLRDHGRIEVGRLSWSDSASRCVDVYRQALDPSRN